METNVIITGVTVVGGVCSLCDWMETPDNGSGFGGDGSFRGILFCSGDVFADGIDIEMAAISGDAVIISSGSGIHRSTEEICLE